MTFYSQNRYATTTLYSEKIKREKRDLNPRHLARQATTLPLSYFLKKFKKNYILIMNKKLKLKKIINQALINKNFFQNTFGLFIKNSNNVNFEKNIITLTKTILKNNYFQKIIEKNKIHFPLKIIFIKNYIEFLNLFNLKKKEVSLIKIYNKIIKGIKLNINFLKKEYFIQTITKII
jgi:hypothetical protein